MTRVTYTGFTVKVKLAPVAFAWNAYRKVDGSKNLAKFEHF
jgi:hypothetical protein